jgi:hypothetical protein
MKTYLFTVLLIATSVLAIAVEPPSPDDYTYAEQNLRNRVIAINAERYSNMTSEERAREFEKLDAKIRADRENLTWRAPIRSEFLSAAPREKTVSPSVSLTPPPTALAPDANRPESFLTPAINQPDSLPSETPYQRLLRLDPLLANKSIVNPPLITDPLNKPNAAQDPKKMEYWQAIATKNIAERYGITEVEREKRQRLLDKHTYESPHVPVFPIGREEREISLREKQLIKSERAKDRYTNY